MIRNTDSKIPFAGSLQGIDAFDSDWSNITITGNKVTTDAYHGISFSSVHDALISDNVVHGDKSPANKQTWLMVGSQTHGGKPSDHVVVRHNTSDSFVFSLPARADVLAGDQNTCTQQLSYQDATGKTFWIKKTGDL